MDPKSTTQQPRTRSQIRRAQRAAAKATRQGQKPGRGTPRKPAVQKVWTPRLPKVEVVTADDSSTILKVLGAFCASQGYKTLVANSKVEDYRKVFETFSAGHDHEQMIKFNQIITRQRDLAWTTLATAIATHAVPGLTASIFQVFSLGISQGEKTTLSNLIWLQKETGKVVKIAFGHRTSKDAVFSALVQIDDGQMTKLEGNQPKSGSLTGISLVESMLASASSPLAQLKAYCGYDNRIVKLQASGLGASKKLSVG